MFGPYNPNTVLPKWAWISNQPNVCDRVGWGIDLGRLEIAACIEGHVFFALVLLTYGSSSMKYAFAKIRCQEVSFFFLHGFRALER